MSDLISRNDAIEAIDFEKVYMTAYLGYVNEGNPLKQYNKGLDDAIKAINKLPSAEPEKKNGRWKPDESGNAYWICSACGFASEASGANILYPFCPNCGAKLDWSDDE